MPRSNLILSILILSVLLAAGLSGFFSVPSLPEDMEEDTTYEEGEVVPFQGYFQKYAPQIGWDWQLLAALCYEESHFNPLARSYMGAQGLMQLMPKTAQRFGLNDSTVWVPEDNIRAGVEYIGKLQKTFGFIDNQFEQTCFVLASYNAGPAHIMDARRLAKRYGRSPYVWFDHTEYWLEQLQTDPYANDSVVIYGAFPNAKETLQYVRKVLRTEHRIKETDS